MSKHVVKSLSVASMIFIGACASYTPLNQSELSERGTHRYPNVSRERLTEASATALATLGYRVTVKQSRKGLVRTAPATIMTSAYGTNYAANLQEDGLAWSMRIDKSGKGAVIHAQPRGFRNGSEYHDDGMWVAEVMDAKFKDLWREIDSSLAAE